MKDSSGNRPTRIQEAKAVAEDLLREMETENHPILRHLMKAQRIARLMRDTEAQTWLGLEAGGYPKAFVFDSLGECKRYALAGGRLAPDQATYSQISLPEAEARCEVEAKAVSSFFEGTTVPAKIDDFLVLQATNQFVDRQYQTYMNMRSNYQSLVSLVAAMKSAVHGYVADTLIGLEYGDVVEDYFQRARTRVDGFVRTHCASATEQLIAIEERMRDGDAESRSAALTSCRRLLMGVADAVFPPSTAGRKGSDGVTRNVDREHYKNRIIAFVESRMESGGGRSILGSNVQHLSARLDAVYDKSCKGVHDEVDLFEAELAVVQTYMILAEVAAAAR